VIQYVPCECCWYQRILMYPIVIISFIALIRQDFDAKYYIRALSIPGILTGGYHYALQKVSFLGDGMAACKGVSCTVQYINWLGFITITLLSFIAFTLILMLAILIKKDERRYFNGKQNIVWYYCPGGRHIRRGIHLHEQWLRRSGIPQ